MRLSNHSQRPEVVYSDVGAEEEEYRPRRGDPRGKHVDVDARVLGTGKGKVKGKPWKEVFNEAMGYLHAVLEPLSQLEQPTEEYVVPRSHPSFMRGFVSEYELVGFVDVDPFEASKRFFSNNRIAAELKAVLSQKAMGTSDRPHARLARLPMSREELAALGLNDAPTDRPHNHTRHTYG